MDFKDIRFIPGLNAVQQLYADKYGVWMPAGIGGGQPTPPTPPIQPREYLRLSSSTVRNIKLEIHISGGVYDPGLEYSTNKTTWTAIPITSTDTIQISIPSPYRGCYLRSTKPLAKFENGTQYTVKLSLSSVYSISGHIASVIDYRQMDTLTEIPDYALCYVFAGISTLTSASELSFDGITTVGVYGCQGMFSYNQNLTSAPALPATTLSEGCYSEMFRQSIALTQAPYLPATELANNCYQQMFNGCRSLNSVRINAEEWGLDYAYNWMYNVSETGTIYAPTGCPVENYSGAHGVPYGWTVVNF